MPEPNPVMFTMNAARRVANATRFVEDNLVIQGKDFDFRESVYERIQIKFTEFLGSPTDADTPTSAMATVKVGLAADNTLGSKGTEKIWNRTVGVIYYIDDYAHAERCESDDKWYVVGGLQDRTVILDDSLPPATNSRTGATSGMATLQSWSAIQERYVGTYPVKRVKVWNHSETTSYATDTFGAIRHIDGHFWFFGDCKPMATRGGA